MNPNPTERMTASTGVFDVTVDIILVTRKPAGQLRWIKRQALQPGRSVYAAIGLVPRECGTASSSSSYHCVFALRPQRRHRQNGVSSTQKESHVDVEFMQTKT